jgi:hypothetical protein
MAELLKEYTKDGTFTYPGLSTTYTIQTVTGIVTGPIQGGGDESEPYYDGSFIQKQLNAIVGNNSGPNNLYSIVLPTGTYMMCGTGGIGCTLRVYQPGDCGEHDVNFAANNKPLFTTGQRGVSSCGIYNQFVNWQQPITLNYTQLEDSTLLHEIVEAIADPYWDGPSFGQLSNPASANPAADFASAYQSTNGELADICEYWAVPQYLNGDQYTLQAIWSNKYQRCLYYNSKNEPEFVGAKARRHAR